VALDRAMAGKNPYRLGADEPGAHRSLRGVTVGDDVKLSDHAVTGSIRCDPRREIMDFGG